MLVKWKAVGYTRSSKDNRYNINLFSKGVLLELFIFFKKWWMAIALTKLQHKQIEEKSETKLQAFQRKIYLKAKQNKEYKFYCLYDKVFRIDFLEEAYKRVKKSWWSGWIDWINFEDLTWKENEFIEEIHNDLKNQTYKPNKTREVKIPKWNWKFRTLKIPTIKDRVVQMSLKLVIEPIFEADFEENSFWYRPNKSAHKAVWKLENVAFQEIYKKEENRKEVKNIDLSNCFDTIPHKELILEIVKRVIDNEIIRLIRMILESGINIEDTDNENKEEGTPQWWVISPLLANIYLDKIDKYWKENGKNYEIFRYADDIVIRLKPKDEQLYQELILYIEKDLKMKVNREKSTTETIKNWITYLWFILKEATSWKWKKYILLEPSKKSKKKLNDNIKQLLNKKNPMSTEEIIKNLNYKLRGWHQYFDNITMSKTRERLTRHIEWKLMRLISYRMKKEWIYWKEFIKGTLYTKYWLYKLKSLWRIF